jgi:uncharacterized protein YdcH (DUF465 family)
MPDAQLSHLDVVRSSLLEQDDEFRQLVSEHHTLDERIRHLASVPYLSDEQQLEEIALKKHKLALKDRIEAILRRHVPANASPARFQ